MKNFRILLFVAVASLFAACDDAIDIKQPSELLPEDTFETVKDLNLGLNGVYGVIPGENHIKFTSVFTDEVRLGIANGGQGRDGELAFVLNNNSGDAASIWLSNYSLVNFANRLLVGAKNVTPVVDVKNGIDETSTYNDIIAQARALRAFGHFQLLTFFSPNLKDDNALGVIALDFVPTKEQKLPRNTNGEVFALINSDLDFAATNLISNTSANKASARTYVSTDFVKALKVRMAIYRGQYNAAEADVDYLLANYPLTKRLFGTATSFDVGKRDDLFAKSGYYRLFRDGGGFTGANFNEVIFKLERAASPSTTTGNFYQAWSSVNSSTTGGAFYEVSTALFNKLHPDDIRRATIIDPTSFPGFNVRPVGKYSESDKTPLLADVKVFRASEMVLLKAEILASRSDFPGVAAQINKIRHERFANTPSSTNGHIAVPGSVQEAWAAILNERRIELAFEGHRYIDIKRLGVLAGASIDRAPSDCSFNNVCFLDATDYRFTMPVPRPEQAANPNIQQNTGYNNQ